MNFLQKNIEAIKDRQPLLAEHIRRLSFKESDIRIFPAKDGHPTLEKLNSAGQPMLLHSKYAPLTESKRLVDSFEIILEENLVVLGLGLGYHLMEILSRPQNRDILLVVEKDPYIFHAFLSTFDVSEKIRSGELSFSINEAPKDIFHKLQIHSFTILENGIKAVKHPPSVRISPDYYESTLKAISDVMVWAKVNTNTQIKSGRKYARNFIENIPELLKNKGAEVLKNLFPNKPAIIVSAGPSLTKNVALLRKAKDKAVIICVDTALRILIQQGIRPDIVVSIDFTPHNFRYFEGLETSDLLLVSDLEVFPDILKQFKGHKLLMNLPGKSLCEWLSSILGDFGSIEKGLSVAHSAFLIGHYMGCDPLVFIGQDLAYTEGISHAKGTSMSRKETVSAGRENLVPVMDIFGRQIVTHVSMHVFLKHFEDLIHTYGKKRPFTCIDATEGGARIEGTEVKSLRDVIKTYCTTDFSPGKRMLDAITTQESFMADVLLIESGALSEKLAIVSNICKRGKTLTEKISRFSWNMESDKEITYLINKEFKKVSKELIEYTNAMKVLKDVAVEEMVIQTKKMPLNPNREDLMGYISKSGRFFQGLSEASDFLSAELQSLCERLNQNTYAKSFFSS